MPAPTHPTPPHFDDPLRPHNPLVGHHWILAGIGVMIVASVAAVYFALGLLFWQGQWQLIFHPSQVVARTPASLNLPFEDVRFDATEVGHTRLDGWWIPANSSLPPQHTAIFYLHDARGSLSDALPDILALHALGQDVFASIRAASERVNGQSPPSGIGTRMRTRHSTISPACATSDRAT